MRSDEAVWRLKVHAFLHDPPENALVLFERGHEERGRALAERLVGPAPDGAAEAIRAADHMASAADREAFLRSVEGLRWAEKPVLRHPLSGEAIDLREWFSEWGRLGVEPGAAREAVDRAVDRLVEAVGVGATSERKFWALWRLLPDYLVADGNGLRMGGLWRYLPAETRMPDHSIWDHQRLVSAVAPILWRRQDPVLLLVAFGPVQGFIGTARRTADLWAGSFILSWLASRAIVPLVEACGPDAVLFPSLWGQPLLDQWLQEEPLRLPLEASEGIGRRASLPNRFLALVPADRVKAIADQCVAAVREEWRRLASEACDAFAGLSGVGRDRLAMFFDRQVPAHLEAYWASSPWPDDPGRCRSMVEARLGANLPQIETIDLGDIGRYRPNVGALYAEAYRAVDLTLGGTKATRLFESVEEPGLKCSLCGDREVVHPGARSARDSKEWWKEFSKQNPRHARQGEALCAVCLVKRLASDRSFGTRIFGAAEETRWGVPSTSEIAAAPFKLAVLRRESFAAARQVVRRLVRDAEQADDRFESETLASVWRATYDLDKQDQDLAQRFVRLDGECFWWGTEEEGRPEGRVSCAVAESAKALVRAVEPLGISRPFPYLGLVRMDGDDMGRWLGGDRPVKLGQTLHPATEVWLRDRLGPTHRLWQEQRRLTPATHAAVSSACGAFALDIVPVLAEDKLAYLIYAGGDDILALVALDDAVELARGIRLAFGGHMAIEDGGPATGFDKGRGFWGVGKRGGMKVVQTLGRAASLSGALVVFHHKYPLQAAVEESLRAEAWAKALRNPDKDALALVIIRRGGQQTRCRLRWTDGAGRADGLRDLLTVSDRVREHLLSPRFHGMIENLLGRADARTLPDGAVELLTRRAVKRHWNHDQVKKAGMIEQDEQEAIEKLQQATWRLRAQAPSTQEWLDALEVAVFLARGGR